MDDPGAHPLAHKFRSTVVDLGLLVRECMGLFSQADPFYQEGLHLLGLGEAQGAFLKIEHHFREKGFPKIMENICPKCEGINVESTYIVSGLARLATIEKIWSIFGAILRAKAVAQAYLGEAAKSDPVVFSVVCRVGVAEHRLRALLGQCGLDASSIHLMADRVRHKRQKVITDRISPHFDKSPNILKELYEKWSLSGQPQGLIYDVATWGVNRSPRPITEEVYCLSHDLKRLLEKLD